MCADHRLAGALEILGVDGEAAVRAFPPTPTPWASVYSVTSGATRRVVRLIELEFARDGVTATEFAAARLLGEHGIGPRVRHADADNGVLIMDEIDGIPATSPIAPWQLHSLARVLRRLHELEMDGEPQLLLGKVLEARGKVTDLVARIPELAVFGEASERFDALREAMGRLGVPNRLCHNDLNHGNVLFDHVRAWLIDFDHLGVGDPLFDVAGAMLSLRMDETQREQFLQTYLGRSADAQETARLELMSCLVLLRYGLSALALVPEHLQDRLAGWTPEMVGADPYDFSRVDGEEVGWLVFRLSLSFVHAGLARLDADPATRATETLGLLGAPV